MGQIVHKYGSERYLLLGVFLHLTFLVSGQTFQASITGNMGLGYQKDDKNIYEPGFSGAGIRFGQEYELSNSILSLLNGIEFSYLGWGNQLLLSNGTALRILPRKRNPEKNSGIPPQKFSLEARFLTMNGVILLRPKLLYSGAMEIGPIIGYRITPNVTLHLAAGYRYSFSPNYRTYGTIWSYSDIPVSFGVSWQSGK